MTIKKVHSIQAKTSVLGADEDVWIDEEESTYSDAVESPEEATADDAEEMEEPIKQDDVNIDIDNNISNHYIAECEKCQGIFISAVTESDQELSSVSGVCPLCGEESDQALKWVITPVKES